MDCLPLMSKIIYCNLYLYFCNRSSRDKLILNNAIREVFVNRFAHLFLSYEHFVIMPQNTSSLERDSTGQSISTADVLNLTPQQQDTVANFDKISFLSDQVKTLLWKFFSNIFYRTLK